MFKNEDDRQRIQNETREILSKAQRRIKERYQDEIFEAVDRARCQLHALEYTLDVMAKLDRVDDGNSYRLIADLVASADMVLEQATPPWHPQLEIPDVRSRHGARHVEE